MNTQSEYNDFIPKEGQRFYFIKEVIEQGLPTLKISSSHFEPSKHKKLLQNHNCYRTKDQAIQSLL